MRAGDLTDVRGRLARQGLADLGEIQMYGGVDTTEKSAKSGGRAGGGSTSRPLQRVQAWGDNNNSSSSSGNRNNNHNNNSSNNNNNNNSSSGNRALNTTTTNNNRTTTRTNNPALPSEPPFDPYTALKSLLYDPPVPLDVLGKKLSVSMTAHNPRIGEYDS